MIEFAANTEKSISAKVLFILAVETAPAHSITQKHETNSAHAGAKLFAVAGTIERVDVLATVVKRVCQVLSTEAVAHHPPAGWKLAAPATRG